MTRDEFMDLKFGTKVFLVLDPIHNGTIDPSRNLIIGVEFVNFVKGSDHPIPMIRWPDYSESIADHNSMFVYLSEAKTEAYLRINSLYGKAELLQHSILGLNVDNVPGYISI